MRFRVVAAAAALALCGAGCATWSIEGEVVQVEAPSPPESGRVQVDAPYFDFAAPLLTGGTFRLSELVGDKVILLQFWGIRCAPCLEEFQLLGAMQQRYGDRGLQVIGVNTDALQADRIAQALAARQLDPPYPIVLDAEFAASKHYTRWLVPVTVLIDRRGVVRRVHTGYKKEMDASIEQEIVEILGR